MVGLTLVSVAVGSAEIVPRDVWASILVGLDLPTQVAPPPLSLFQTRYEPGEARRRGRAERRSVVDAGSVLGPGILDLNYRGRGLWPGAGTRV